MAGDRDDLAEDHPGQRREDEETEQDVQEPPRESNHGRDDDHPWTPARETTSYGLLAVCSASKVKVASEVAPWRVFPAVSGRLTRKHRTSLAPPASDRSP